jgi:hypothetical protein
LLPVPPIVAEWLHVRSDATTCLDATIRWVASDRVGLHYTHVETLNTIYSEKVTFQTGRDEARDMDSDEGP